jgi:hypothetical protein
MNKYFINPPSISIIKYTAFIVQTPLIIKKNKNKY